MVSDMELGVELQPKDEPLTDMDTQKMPVDFEPQGDAEMPNTSGQGGSGGGGAGGSGMPAMLGSMSKKMGAILGIIGILVMLEPIQQVLSAIMRFLEVMILPFVAIMMQLLQPLMQKLLKVMPDIIRIAGQVGDLLTDVFGVLFDVADRIAQSVINSIPFLGDGGGGRGDGTGLPREQSMLRTSDFDVDVARTSPLHGILQEMGVTGGGFIDLEGRQDTTVLPEQRFSDKTDESKKESMTGTTTTEGDKTYGGS